MKPLQIDGEMWYQWAQRLFEFENCAECGKGVRGHWPTVFFGHWFAKCKASLNGEGQNAPLS